MEIGARPSSGAATLPQGMMLWPRTATLLRLMIWVHLCSLRLLLLKPGGAPLNRGSRRQEPLTCFPRKRVSLLTSAATRFKERVAKLGIRNPAARRVRTIAPAGNGGPAGFSPGGNGGNRGSFPSLLSLFALVQTRRRPSDCVCPRASRRKQEGQGRTKRGTEPVTVLAGKSMQSS